MKIVNGIIVNDGTTKTFKLSEQGIMSITMVIQKIFTDLAQDRETKSLDELLENYDFILDENEELWVCNPVSVSIDKAFLEDDEDDEDEDKTDKN